MISVHQLWGVLRQSNQWKRSGMIFEIFKDEVIPIITDKKRFHGFST